MERKVNTPYDCPESVTGHGDPDRKGLCPWCRRKIDSRMPKPPPERVASELEEAYGMMWDPDWGAK